MGDARRSERSHRAEANGVTAPRVAELAIDIRRELGIPDSAVVALLVATLRSEKDVPVFVRAVLRARQTHGELVGLMPARGRTAQP